MKIKHIVMAFPDDNITTVSDVKLTGDFCMLRDNMHDLSKLFDCVRFSIPVIILNYSRIYFSYI